MRDDLIGANVGGFVIEEQLGRGGMGVVYRAHEPALRRTVALKLLAPQFLDDATARTRFQREIKHAVAIEHPHVVPVYDAGYEDGYFYLAMRYVGGPDLWRVVKSEGRLPEPRALRLIGQIASALWTVHQQGIVHRDVKPQNVLVWSSGAIDEHAFLTDFGIARALDEVLRLTRAGALGTPGYMAPELVAGGAPTPACDQYSLACLAFELLTGELPFGTTGSAATGSSNARPHRLSTAFYGSGVSKRVRETIERALSADPADRFPDVRAFVMADEALQESFEDSRAMAETLRRTRTDSDLVTGLQEQGVTDARIAEIADLEKSQVVKLRRKAARRSLVGE